MKKRIADMAPGTQFRILGSLYVRVNGTVTQGSGQYMAVSIETGAVACPAITSHRMFEYEVIKEPGR